MKVDQILPGSMQSLTHTSACTVLPRSRSDGRCQQSRLNRSHVTVRAEVCSFASDDTAEIDVS